MKSLFLLSRHRARPCRNPRASLSFTLSLVLRVQTKRRRSLGPSAPLATLIAALLPSHRS